MKRRYSRDNKLLRRVAPANTPNFSKLAFMSQRAGEKGQHALQVLQDALLEYYGPQFRDAIRKAKKKQPVRSVKTWTVIFAPTMERAYHDIQRKIDGAPYTGRRKRYDDYPEGSDLRARRLKDLQGTLEWYKKNHWPFSVTTKPHTTRATAIVVWDTYHGFDTHDWARWKREER